MNAVCKNYYFIANIGFEFGIEIGFAPPVKRAWAIGKSTLAAQMHFYMDADF